MHARLTRGFVATLALAAIVFAGGFFLPPDDFLQSYEPRDGDIVFQSLPRSQLTDTIEGVTHSPYSHCGLVVQQNGRWYVYESIGNVHRTSLASWFYRSRGYCFAAYRLDDENQQYVPKMIEYVKACVGLPYDMRYRLDDERIYCSELVSKAYRHGSGKMLGQIVKLGDLDWQPHQRFIRQLEGGPVPVDREMITPADLAKAPELKLVTKYGH